MTGELPGRFLDLFNKNTTSVQNIHYKLLYVSLYNTKKKIQTPLL